MRESIKAKMKARLQDSLIAVPVPEWDTTVYLSKRLTLRDTLALQGATEGEGQTAKIIIAICKDKDGKPVFTLEDIDDILAADTDALSHILDKFNSITGATDAKN